MDRSKFEVYKNRVRHQHRNRHQEANDKWFALSDFERKCIGEIELNKRMIKDKEICKQRIEHKDSLACMKTALLNDSPLANIRVINPALDKLNEELEHLYDLLNGWELAYKRYKEGALK